MTTLHEQQEAVNAHLRDIAWTTLDALVPHRVHLATRINRILADSDGRPFTRSEHHRIRFWIWAYNHRPERRPTELPPVRPIARMRHIEEDVRDHPEWFS